MSFLNQEDREAVADLFKEGNQVEDNNIEPVEAAPAVETQPQTDENTEESSTFESNEDSGHAVPYSRFKSVIEARNDLRSKTSALESQLSELRSQLDSKNTQPVRQEQSYDSVIEYDDLSDYDNYDDPYDQKLQTYEDRIYQMEVTHEQQKLSQEIGIATQRFPEVSKDVILQAVINDPDVDIMDVAERYSTFVSGLRESAIAEYLQTNPQGAPPVIRPDAPPVISSAGSSLSGRLPGSSRTSRPQNMDQARDSLFDYLKANWSN